MEIFSFITLSWATQRLTAWGMGYALSTAMDKLRGNNIPFEKDIKIVFKKAIDNWDPHGIVRSSKKKYLIDNIQKYLDNPDSFKKLKSQDVELYKFYKIFQKELASSKTAYKYLKDIKDQSSYENIISEISELKDIITEGFDNLEILISDKLSNDSALVEEWKREVKVYYENIEEFKPRTALKLLSDLEESFVTNSISPPKVLRANLEFNKALCYNLTGEKDKVYECFIKAYKLNQLPVTYKEKACYSYYKIEKDYDKANKLVVDILEIDEYNPTAWAIKILVSDLDKLDFTLSTTPDIVLNNIDFKSIVFFDLRLNPNSFDSEILQKYDIAPSRDYEQVEPIKLDNYKSSFYKIEGIASKFVKSVLSNPLSKNILDNEYLVYVNSTFKTITDTFILSEIREQHQRVFILYYYTEYLLSRDKEYVLKMKEEYLLLDKKDDLYTVIIVNVLREIEDNKSIVGIIDEFEGDNDSLNFIKAEIYFKEGNYDGYTSTLIETIKSIKIIDIGNVHNLIHSIEALFELNKLDVLPYEDFIEEKKYESETLKSLVEEVVKVIYGKSDEHSIDKLQSIEESIYKIAPYLLFHITVAYQILDKHELIVKLGDKYISKDNESMLLYNYILALHLTKERNKELIDLLLKWRKDFSFNLVLLKMEADLMRRLDKWDSINEIADYYLSKISNDELFLTYKLLAINILEDKGKLVQITNIKNRINEIDIIKKENIRAVAYVLLENSFYEDALELLYKEAKKTNSVEDKMTFFGATVGLPKNIVKSHDTVQEGSYVKYITNDNSVQNTILVDKRNKFYKDLIGHKTGDKLSIETGLSKQLISITIIRIMDKYLALHDEILNNVKVNPLEDFPMTSIEFESGNIDDINKKMSSIFGHQNKQEKEAEEKYVEEYYNYHHSLLEVIIHNYGGDYITGYFDLIWRHQGIVQVPLGRYNKFNFSGKKIILDFSSIFIIYQIHKNQGIDYKNKFIIAKSTYDIIDQKYTEELHSPKEQLYLEIMPDKVIPAKKTEQDKKQNLSYLSGLLEWINNNCEIVNSINKLDVLRRLEEKGEKNEIFETMVENLSILLDNKNSIIVSDDLSYHKLSSYDSNQVFSTEIYIKSTLKEQVLELAEKEFIQNKYIGYSMHPNSIYKEFIKMQKGQSNTYLYCINNLSINYNPYRTTAKTAIDYLKNLSLKSLLADEELRREMTKVFVSLLNGQSKIEPFTITRTMISQEFKLLGTKLDLIISSYNDALTILGKDI